MKMFVVLALAAAVAADPEADAGYVYSRGAYPSAYQYLRPVRPYTAYPGFYNGIYNTPVVHSIGKREAEAEPAVVYTGGYPVHTYSTLNHVAAPVTTYSAAHHVAAPVATYSAAHHVAAPVATYSAVHHVAAPVAAYSAAHHVAAPIATYSAAHHVAAPVATYSAVAPATHSVTSYNNPNHFTAVSNGVYGPKYVAKNHGVEHVVKRDADAEPQVVYSAPSVPVTYSHVVPAVHGAVPAVHGAVPVTYAGVPATYAGVPATYAGVPATYAGHHVVKSAYAPHAVAATPLGYTHSSNVGVCTNNAGVQVPC